MCRFAWRNDPYRSAKRPISQAGTPRFACRFRSKSTVFGCFSADISVYIIAQFPHHPRFSHDSQAVSLAHSIRRYLPPRGFFSARTRFSEGFCMPMLRFLTFVYGMRCAVVVCPPDFHTASDGGRGVPRVCSFASCSYKLRRKKRANSFAFRLICTNFAL